jgi:hypothetical protein
MTDNCGQLSMWASETLALLAQVISFIPALLIHLYLKDHTFIRQVSCNRKLYAMFVADE